MNKFFDWFGKQVWSWVGTILAIALGAGLLFGCLWFASWTIKGFLMTWGWM